jgi:hypothetical protein
MCDACEHAEHRPAHSMFRASCKQCQARQLAHGQDYWQSERAKELTPQYRQALKSTFGDQWPQWHEAVKVWAKRIKETR